MVYGVLRLINFAHSEIFMIGTFGVFATLNALGVKSPFSGVALVAVMLLCLVVGMFSSGAAAVVLEFVAYRPLRKKGASRLAALISAIGASIFLQELFALEVLPWLFERQRPDRLPLPVPRLVNRDVLFTIGNANIRLDQVIIVISAVIMMV